MPFCFYLINSYTWHESASSVSHSGEAVLGCFWIWVTSVVLFSSLECSCNAIVVQAVLCDPSETQTSACCPCRHVCVCGMSGERRCVHMHVEACRAQKCQIPLKLELRTDVSCLTWVLGTNIRSSARATNTLSLKHWVISPVSALIFIVIIFGA